MLLRHVQIRQKKKVLLTAGILLCVCFMLLRYHVSNGPISQHWKTFTKSSIHRVGAIFPKDSPVPATVSSSYVIENAGICSSLLTLTYVIIVHTAPKHFERRARLRKTWANNTYFKGINSRVVFLLGSVPDWRLQRKIYLESNQFGDIVQGTFRDHYRNLTLKAVMGLRWVTENCPQADYVIKTDDDVFVNIPQVMKSVFPILSKQSRQIVCSVEPHASIFREGGPEKSLEKWMMPQEYFESLEKYPMPFCYGYVTFYTTTLASELFKMAKSTPFYRLDDVYVYGILASKVRGVTWRDASETYYNNEKDTRATLDNQFSKPLIAGVVNTEEDMMRLFRQSTQSSSLNNFYK
ncbi:beta-1,3-galactosyltransferase 5-like [Liolophura sinensis]|uniref:beta-1,3-galactosyltransferase 5-like n=1 Tax=Liolophura sinensis TaxID=3198878 RepID=UPI0031586C4A